MTPSEKKSPINIMLVAGEPSGDQLGAQLADSLKRLAGGRKIEMFGAAGIRMRRAGVDAAVESDGLAIMGVAEIGRALPTFLRAFNKLRRTARERDPDAVVLIDFPDFNLKLAKALKKQGRRVVYYVSPQLWGWRQYRLRTIRDHVDLLLAILPFEKEWYSERGVTNVKYVGHPLAENVEPSLSRKEFCSKHNLDGDQPLVALLPGSRHKEISRILPPMIEAAALLRAELPRIQFVVPLAPTRTEKEVLDAAEAARQRSGRSIPDLCVVRDETYDALYAADAAAVASGTATLEAGILGTPLAIVYKTSGLNYRLVRPLIDVEHFGLINLIAGKRIAAELIQDDFTPEALAGELWRILGPGVNEHVRAGLRNATRGLGAGGGSDLAAAAILELIGIEPEGSLLDAEPVNSPLE